MKHEFYRYKVDRTKFPPIETLLLVGNAGLVSFPTKVSSFCKDRQSWKIEEILAQVESQ